MTYNDWLDSLVSPIQYFISWLISIADSLIHNYFFITLLGITLFLSLVWFIFYLIYDFIDSINDRYDDYNDKYYNYELFKEVQSDYLDKHYNDEYDYRYRSKVLNSQVLNGYLEQNEDLDVDNRRLAYLHKIEALKDVKRDKLTDDDDSNDDDINLIIPPQNTVTFNDLKFAQLHSLHEELKNEINSDIDRIYNENEYLYDGYKDYFGVKIPSKIFYSDDFNTDYYDVIGKYPNRHLIDKRTGEVIADIPGDFLLPSGPITVSNLSPERRAEIERNNDLNEAKLDSGDPRYFMSYDNWLNMDDDMESQLFSSNYHIKHHNDIEE